MSMFLFSLFPDFSINNVILHIYRPFSFSFFLDSPHITPYLLPSTCTALYGLFIVCFLLTRFRLLVISSAEYRFLTYHNLPPINHTITITITTTQLSHHTRFYLLRRGQLISTHSAFTLDELLIHGPKEFKELLPQNKKALDTSFE